MKSTRILIMTMLLALSLLLLTACGSDPAGKESSLSPEETAAAQTEESPYGIATEASAEEVEQFAAQVKEAYLARNWQALSVMVEYPLDLFGEQVRNEQEFVAAMESHAVSESSLRSVEEEPCTDLFANDQGIAMADGIVWFRDTAFDGITQTGTPSFKIFAINTILE